MKKLFAAFSSAKKKILFVFLATFLFITIGLFSNSIVRGATGETIYGSMLFMDEGPPEVWYWMIHADTGFDGQKIGYTTWHEKDYQCTETGYQTAHYTCRLAEVLMATPTPTAAPTPEPTAMPEPTPIPATPTPTPEPTWNTLAEPLSGHTSVVANGFVYVIGGGTITGQTSAVRYAKLNSDGSTSAWTTTSSLPRAIGAHSSVVANGYVYAIGGSVIGSGGSVAQNTAYYAKLNSDGSLGAWATNVNPLPKAIIGHTSVTANGYVYVMGGYDGGAYLSSVYYAKLNPDGSTANWMLTKALPKALLFPSSVLSSAGYVYVTGGSTTKEIYLSTAYSAKLNVDGSIGRWSTAPSLPYKLRGHTSAISNGYAYVMGGHDGTKYLPNVYFAKINPDGTAGNWLATNPLPESRYQASSIVANGKVQVLGGSLNYTSPTNRGSKDTIFKATPNLDGTLGNWFTNPNQ